MKRWYVVHTKAGEEEKAVFHLNNQGYDVYLPRYSKLRRHARKVERVLRPLFPRYLFLRADIENETWRSVNGTVGVCYLMVEGCRPIAVPEGIVEAIQARESEDGAVSLAPMDLTKGDKLRLTEGAFADAVGVFEEATDNNRVRLLLDIMGREVRVSTSVEYLAKAS